MERGPRKLGFRRRRQRAATFLRPPSDLSATTRHALHRRRCPLGLSAHAQTLAALPGPAVARCSGMQSHHRKRSPPWTQPASAPLKLYAKLAFQLSVKVAFEVATQRRGRRRRQPSTNEWSKLCSRNTVTQMVATPFVPPALHGHFHTFAVVMVAVGAGSHHVLTINVAASVIFNLSEHPMDLLLHLPASSFRLVWPKWRWHCNCGPRLQVASRFFQVFVRKQQLIAVGEELFLLEEEGYLTLGVLLLL